MKKFCTLITLWVFFGVLVYGQELKTKNLIIVTLDGLRWQEVFDGADSQVLSQSRFVKDAQQGTRFWKPSSEARRRELLPFLWNVVGSEGQLYGNRFYRNEVNCANPYWFSYPGYSEMLTGIVDRHVRSNAKVENPNPTILEFINQKPEFSNKVAAFGSWDVFPFILREQSADIPVNAGKELAMGELTDTENFLNNMYTAIQSREVTRPDVFTFHYAFEYLKARHPRVLFIGLDETDTRAHRGQYDQYLNAAHNSDQLISALWEWVQSDPDYKDKTTLVITTDHGRGKGKGSWRNHGRGVAGSGQVWLAVIGPDTPPTGEMKEDRRYYLNQVAATCAAFLGFEFYNVAPVGNVIMSTLHRQPTDVARSK
jgi:hypothetical protein